MTPIEYTDFEGIDTTCPKCGSSDVVAEELEGHFYRFYKCYKCMYKIAENNKQKIS